MASTDNVTVRRLKLFWEKAKEELKPADDYDESFVFQDILFVDGEVKGKTLFVSSPKASVKGSTLYL